MRKDIENLCIGGFPFTIRFVDKSEIEGSDGLCCHNERVIKIRNDLDNIATRTIIMHEITHALLGTQGRVYQQKFSVEELCEFIAYRFPELTHIYETITYQIMSKVLKDDQNNEIYPY